MKHIAVCNGKEVPDLTILKAIALRDNQDRDRRQQYSYLDLFRGRQIATRTIVLLFTW
jgi:hypothetical protein